MASSKGVKQSVKEKELIIHLKAKDSEITKLTTKIRRLEECHKKELKSAQDSSRKDGQALQIQTASSKRTEEELCAVTETLEKMKDQISLVAAAKDVLATTCENLTGQLLEREKQLLQLQSAGGKCVSRFQTSLIHILQFLEKVSVNSRIQPDHAILLSDLECLQIQLRTFESLQRCAIE